MKRRRWRRVAAVVVVAVLVAAGVPAGLYLLRDEPVVYADVAEQFKYGSVGTEADQGIPYLIWAVLPDVFPDLLPEGEGESYERFGFLFERGRERPIGMTYREKPIGLTGLNCSLCHVGTYRETPGSPRERVLGMPANRLRIDAYIEFLRAVGTDDRFAADTLLDAIERRFPGELNALERAFYRALVIPQTRKGLGEVDHAFRWQDGRPAYGPGRVDTFTPWKERFDFDVDNDPVVGTADFPPIWLQRLRRSLPNHWDGNNASLLERNISASLAVGATPDSLDLDELGRVGNWLLDLRPPPYPDARLDEELARRGKPLYEDACSSCHDLDGPRIGDVIPVEEIGTDPGRARSFPAELAKEMNTLGDDEPWAFHNFRSTGGYVNGLLDGIWLRAPYLHNGSVPTLRALLFPDERPRVFYTGYDVYDWDAVGFVWRGRDAKREGFRFDTRLPGNGNRGHTYGSGLSAAEREAILEYLKTL